MARPIFPLHSQSNTYLKKYILQKLSPYKSLKKSDILEIGIGNGRFGWLLGNEFARYYGIDIDKEYVEIAEKNIPKNAKIVYKVGNAEKIPFTKKFDILFYAQSWHFIKNHSKALHEARRVLKKDGILAILEPTENSDWLSPRLQKDSPQFNELLYKQKMKNLARGREAIEQQCEFTIILKEYDETLSKNLYILQRL